MYWKLAKLQTKHYDFANLQWTLEGQSSSFKKKKKVIKKRKGFMLIGMFASFQT